MSSRNPKSILYGVDDVIEKWLGITGNNDYGKGKKDPRYSSKTAAKKLTKQSVNVNELFPAKQILDKIQSNWDAGGKKRRSKENWRWEPRLKLDPRNKGEKELEKLAAFLLEESEWTNQIPVCSGLMPEYDEVHRAIDLGRKISDNKFEFIELKFRLENGNLTGDRHPLYAALELLEYGMLYLFARANELIEKSKDLRQAGTVHLVVLGPEAWYSEYNDFQWLANAINKGLDSLLKTEWCASKQEVVMSLCFRKINEEFIEPYNQLKKGIESFRSVFPVYQPVYK